MQDGETATETPDAVRLQNAFTGLDQPPPPCNRCAHLGDASLAAAASYTNPGPPPDDRKPVCVYCWQTGSTCDREPQCQSCVEEERTCVHKLCDGGARCTRRGCMRLHPVQWDRCDPRWTVEEGRMPEQGVVVKEEDRGT